MSEYEYTTDEFALALECATGLIDFRAWLYGFVSEEVRREKEENYCTPDEIHEWMSHQ